MYCVVPTQHYQSSSSMCDRRTTHPSVTGTSHCTRLYVVSIIPASMCAASLHPPRNIFHILASLYVHCVCLCFAQSTSDNCLTILPDLHLYSLSVRHPCLISRPHFLPYRVTPNASLCTYYLRHSFITVRSPVAHVRVSEICVSSTLIHVSRSTLK
jgi:hypothetical protein